MCTLCGAETNAHGFARGFAEFKLVAKRMVIGLSMMLLYVLDFPQAHLAKVSPVSDKRLRNQLLRLFTVPKGNMSQVELHPGRGLPCARFEYSITGRSISPITAPLLYYSRPRESLFGANISCLLLTLSFLILAVDYPIVKLIRRYVSCLYCDAKIYNYLLGIKV